MDIQLIALDLDGTALNSHGLLTKATQLALKEASDAGIVIAAATGRAYSALPEFIRNSPIFTYAITSNGTGIYRTLDRARIYSNLMTESNLNDLLSLLAKYDCPMEAFIDGIAYADSRYVQDPESFHVSARSASYVRATRKPIDDIPELIRQNLNRVEGMDIIVTDMTLKKEIREQAEQITDLYVTSSVAHYLEFAAGGATKETALAHLTRLLNLSPSQVMTFGDGENDLEMLRFAGIGVAMGNACNLLKETADYITASNDEDGIAQAIRHFIFL